MVSDKIKPIPSFPSCQMHNWINIKQEWNQFRIRVNKSVISVKTELCFSLKVVIHLTDGLDAPYAEMKRQVHQLQQSGKKMIHLKLCLITIFKPLRNDLSISHSEVILENNIVPQTLNRSEQFNSGRAGAGGQIWGGTAVAIWAWLQVHQTLTSQYNGLGIWAQGGTGECLVTSKALVFALSLCQ